MAQPRGDSLRRHSLSPFEESPSPIRNHQQRRKVPFIIGVAGGTASGKVYNNCVTSIVVYDICMIAISLFLDISMFSYYGAARTGWSGFRGEAGSYT